jgi:type II secretory pathway pseudopilin PulG
MVRTGHLTIRGKAPSAAETGFSYIGVLILLAILSAALAATMDVWHTTMQREKEKELLFVGNQFRAALQSYYTGGGGKVPAGRYPTRIDDLLLDGRSPTIVRHLRKLFVDPITGKAEWGLVTLPDGEIIGVHSLSDDEPLKQAGFLQRDADFEGKTKYSEWVFSFKVQAPATAAPGGGPRIVTGNH